MKKIFLLSDKGYKKNTFANLFGLYEYLFDLQSSLSFSLWHEEVVEEVGGERDGSKEPVSSVRWDPSQEGWEYFDHNEDVEVKQGGDQSWQNLVLSG